MPATIGITSCAIASGSSPSTLDPCFLALLPALFGDDHGKLDVAA
jgi:hypothetical protein